MNINIETPLIEPPDIEEPSVEESTVQDDYVFDSTLLGAKGVSVLESIFKSVADPSMVEGLANTASVKFMITKQDETELNRLGYSAAQINSIKPQEAADIILAGTKAETITSLE
jgi:hypothetical protein